MRRLIVAALAVSLLGLPVHVGAEPTANRRKPPRVALLYKNEVVQRARPYTYCWSYSNSDGTGTGICADGFPRYPAAVEVQAPARLVMRIRYPVKPSDWFINAYRMIARHDHYDENVGSPEPIPFKLKPHRVDGKIRAWNAVFRVTEPLRDYYLDTGGQLHQGDAFYSLHVRTT